MCGVIEARLNLHSLMDNSRTVEDMIRSPAGRNYLSWNDSKDKSFRNRSPKEIKIDEIPEDIEVYQEINIIKGKSKNSHNFVVNKVFKNKKNAVKFILNRKVNETAQEKSKLVVKKSKIFK